MTRLRSQRVITPAGEHPADIVIDNDGVITDVMDINTAVEVDRDFGDLVLMPGLVDTHVHVNEPGRTAWEGFATATRAAAAGGVTTICDMPLNAIPPTTTVAGLEAKLAAARGQLWIDVGFV